MNSFFPKVEFREQTFHFHTTDEQDINTMDSVDNIQLIGV